MEPVTSLIAGASARGAVSLVASYIKGKASKSDLLKLSVQYWGCVLFEMRRNLIQIAMVVADGRPQRGDNVPALAFPYYDALVGDIATLAPMPLLSALAGRVNASLRAIDRLVGVQLQAGAMPLQGGTTTGTTLNIGAAWRSHAEANITDSLKAYNDLVGAVGVDGQSAYKDEWPTVAKMTLPEPLPNVPAAAAAASEL